MKVSRLYKLRWFIPIILFLSLIIDSALPAIFPGEFLAEHQLIVSHMMLFSILMFAFYFRERDILYYSLLFGFLADSYTSTIIGIYMTVYWLAAYIVYKVKRYLPKRMLVHFVLFLIAIAVVDFVVFVFYREIGLTTMTMTVFIVERLVPTMIFNTVMAFILYFPSRGILTWLGHEEYYII